MKRYESYKDSGVKWLGEIPGHWEVRKIKYTFKERSQKGFPKLSLLSATQQYGVIKKDDYENRTVVATKGLDTLKLVCKNDFVISLRSFEGGIEMSHEEGIISPAYTILIPKKIEPSYFRHLGKSPVFINLLKMMVTGIREGQNIDYNKLRTNLIPIPPKSEQTAIANYLDSVTSKIDEAISQQQKMIDLLNERKQIIIQNAVTKGLDPNAKMKDSGVEWIGEIPEDWERTYLKHIYVFEKGKNAQLYSSEYIGRNIGKYPVYSGQTENDGIMGYVNVCEYNIDECIFTTTVGAKVMTPRILRGKFTLSQNCLIMIPKNKPHHNLYIFYVLSIIFRYMKSEIPSYMQPSLRISDLNRISMYLPPYKTQIDIANFLKQNLYKIDSSINMSNKMISLLQERKQIIINDVVTGKVKVI